MSRRRDRPLHPELLEDLNEAHAAAEDMPDGAWFATLEDTVTQYNYRTGHGYDPNDAVHKWIRTAGQLEEVVK